MAVGISYIMAVGLFILIFKKWWIYDKSAWYIVISFGHSSQDKIIYEVYEVIFLFSFVVEKLHSRSASRSQRGGGGGGGCVCVCVCTLVSSLVV